MPVSPNIRASTSPALLVCAALTALAGIQLLPFLTWDALALAEHGLLIDDAFFYSTVAAKWLQHGFPTLDGEMSTNGFQPLWMLIHVGLAWLFPHADGAVTGSRLSWLLYVSFVAVTSWHLVRRTAVPLWSLGGVAALALVQPAFQRIVVRGLEVPLLLLLLSIMLVLLDRYRDRLGTAGSPGQAWTGVQLGALAGLIFLARTDMFVVAVVVLAWLFLRQRRLGGAIVGFCAACAVVVLPYLLWNYLTQQGVMPISGRVKLHYMHVFLPTVQDYFRSDEWQGSLAAFDNALNLPVLPVPFAVRALFIGGLLLGGLAAMWSTRASSRVPASLKLLTVVIWLHLLVMHLVHRELRPYTSYYFAPAILWLGLVATTMAAMWLPSLGRGARVLRPAIVTGALACIALGWYVNRVQPVPGWVERIALARDIQRLVPPGEKVAAFWPGCFAHFSGRDVVPSDGIIGSNAYFRDYVKSARELDYLREKQVRYLAIRLFDGDHERITQPGRASAPPRIRQWDNLGIKRLYDNRHLVRRTVAVRPLGDGGWFLFELAGS
jgi:hypothetical protein